MLSEFENRLLDELLELRKQKKSIEETIQLLQGSREKTLAELSLLGSLLADICNVLFEPAESAPDFLSLVRNTIIRSIKPEELKDMKGSFIRRYYTLGNKSTSPEILAKINDWEAFIERLSNKGIKKRKNG